MVDSTSQLSWELARVLTVVLRLTLNRRRLPDFVFLSGFRNCFARLRDTSRVRTRAKVQSEIEGRIRHNRRSVANKVSVTEPER